MLIGYRVTSNGKAALETLVRGEEFIWLPNYNYERLNAMLLALNKLTMNSRDDWFSIEPEVEESKTLLALKALERDGLIERSRVPGIERFLRLERYLEENPSRRHFYDTSGDF